MHRTLLACCLLLIAGSPAAAQDRPDVIRGVITGPDSLPIASANVRVSSMSSNTAKQARTDKDGVFSVVFPQSEGDYWVTVQAVGFTSRRFAVKRFGAEEVLNADAMLAKSIQSIAPVRVNANRPSPGTSDMSASVLGTDVTRTLTASTGIGSMSDPNAFALFLPAAMYIPSVDGTLGSFSVHGLDPMLNTTVLNGLTVGADLVPRDAAMSAAVASSQYDASRPGSAGGQTRLTFGSGGNTVVRTLSFTGLSPRLQWTDRTTQAIGNRPTRVSVGGRIAGPLVRNNAFYNVAFQMDQNAYRLRTLLDTDALGLEAAGLASDSVTRLRDVLAGLGVPYSVDHFPTSNLARSGSFVARVNYAPLSSRLGDIALTASGNWRRVTPASSSLLSETPAHSARTIESSGAIGAEYHKMLGTSVFSSSTIGATSTRSKRVPYVTLPSAVVRVGSELSDGTIAVRNVQVGGLASLGDVRSSAGVQATSGLSWLTMDGRHSLRLAANYRRDTYKTDQSSNLLGTFLFNSIDDLEAGRAASFSRQLAERAQSVTQGNWGLGVIDWLKLPRNLELTTGARIDGVSYAGRPVRNPLVDEAFGARNDFLPRPFSISPSISFSKGIGTSPQIAAYPGVVRGPHYQLTGGVGVFTSAPFASLATEAMQRTGLATAIQDLSCVGAAAPIPDWHTYATDPLAVPDACTDGSINTVFATGAPAVTLIDRGYRGVRRNTGELNFRGPLLGNRFNAALNMSYSRNDFGQHWVDLNFDPTARFALGDEGGRPVFVEEASIVPQTGAIAIGDARRSPLFSRVSAIRSDLRSDSRTLSLVLAPIYDVYARFWYSLRYTYQRNRQMLGGWESTAGNPMIDTRALLPTGQDHRLTLSLRANIRNTVKVSWNMFAASGGRFTPGVVGDVNGDGASNDRPFIFDPGTTADSALAAGMRNLLTNGSSVARRCLRDQVGSFAAPRSCRMPWSVQGSYALQVLINPLALRMPQRASLQFEIGNPVGAVDMLLHGPGGIRGWGRPQSPSTTLLYVKGFDPESKRFVYDVNPRFGATTPRQNLNRTAPVTVTALFRIDVGPSRERQNLTQIMDRGRRNTQPIATEPVLKSAMGASEIPNPMLTILLQGDLLGLTPAQGDTLSQLTRVFVVGLDSIWTPIARSLAALPHDYARGEAYAIYMRGREASFDRLIRIAPTVRNVLTPAQRRLLPSLVAAQLDVRFLQAVRSSSVGLSDGMFTLGSTGNFSGFNMFSVIPP